MHRVRHLASKLFQVVPATIYCMRLVKFTLFKLMICYHSVFVMMPCEFFAYMLSILNFVFSSLGRCFVVLVFFENSAFQFYIDDKVKFISFLNLIFPVFSVSFNQRPFYIEFIASRQFFHSIAVVLFLFF